MSFSFSNRYGGERWFRLGSVDVTTTVLIAGLAAISILAYAVDPNVVIYLALVGNNVIGGEVWRLLTWPLANSPPLLSPVLSIVFFFLFGRELEHLLGRDRFLKFILLMIVIPAVIGVVYAALAQDFAIGGIGLLTDGVVVAYVAVNPTARSFFDIPLWVLAAVIIGIDALTDLGDRALGNLLFLILIVGVGLLGAKAFGISRLTWIPRVPLPAIITGDRATKEHRKAVRKSRSAAKLKVIRSDDIDSLLDKIATHGINSLSDDERRRLDEHSKESRN